MVIPLDRKSPIPLYRQIRNHFAGLIAEGLLGVGSRLPPTRELADSLEVSRTTVVQAYEELEATGLITSRVGRGAFVNQYLPRKGSHGAKPRDGEKLRLEGMFSASWMHSMPALNGILDQLTRSPKDAGLVALDSALPEPELFPLVEFRDCLQSALRRYGSELLTAGPPAGFEPLLEYLPVFLARRNIVCEPHQLMIVSGMQQGLSLLGKLFLNPGDTVALENLTYPGALWVFRSLQASLIGIPVDADGLRVDVLENVLRRTRVKLLYTIPTYQNPTGAVLSQERRQRLVELCRRHQVLIVEDDYAHEFGYERREWPPLKSWDECDGIVYLGSFSELLFPGIRLSWILAPRAILDRLLLLKQSSDLFTNRILQGALLLFCERGYLGRHLKRKRLLYRHKRDFLLEAMQRHFPAEAHWEKARGGLFQWVDLPEEVDALEMLMRSREQRVVFAPDRLFSVAEWERAGLRLSFVGAREEQLERGVKVIAGILKGEGTTT
jgi:2-aminoadipate transaminase